MSIEETPSVVSNYATKIANARATTYGANVVRIRRTDRPWTDAICDILANGAHGFAVIRVTSSVRESLNAFAAQPHVFKSPLGREWSPDMAPVPHFENTVHGCLNALMHMARVHPHTIVLVGDEYAIDADFVATFRGRLIDARVVLVERE